MNRRTFIKLTSMAGGAIALFTGRFLAPGGKAVAHAAAGKAGTGASGKSKPLPDWAKNIRSSDMNGLGPDGKPDPDYNANGTGASRVGFKHDPKKPHQMKLTKEEQDILNGKKGEVLAKVMKTVVSHGNAFGATKLVDLGGRPHSSFYMGPPYCGALLDVLKECADAGLKSYAPYTINPRPADLYNVMVEPDEAEMAFEGYPLQMKLDYVHVLLGGEGLSSRSCACYVPEVGNIPKPGTYVAWAESSAVNAGNSILGLRTNRNATGMEILCALLGKAPPVWPDDRRGAHGQMADRSEDHQGAGLGGIGRCYRSEVYRRCALYHRHRQVAWR